MTDLSFHIDNLGIPVVILHTRMKTPTHACTHTRTRTRTRTHAHAHAHALTVYVISVQLLRYHQES